MILIPPFTPGASVKSTPTGWSVTNSETDPAVSFVPDKFDWYRDYIAVRTANFKVVLSGNGSSEALGTSTCCEIPR